MDDFKSFSKIESIQKSRMIITQKIHGTNAQIYIYEKDNLEIDLKVGSRSRWLSEGDDNYGFFKFVHQHKQEFIQKLGIGRHFGEWCGLGINSGEGLNKKILCLFNSIRWTIDELPPNTVTVPILYYGLFSQEAINRVMDDLRERGSMLCPGFMKPEGIVIQIGTQLFKNVFKPEEIAWKQTVKKEPRKDKIDVSHLLQPLRLDKLISRDEKYIREYPKSLGNICKDYVQDLEEEHQFDSREEVMEQQKKVLGKKIFYFVKSICGALK